MNEEQLVEELADAAHESWSGWMRYLFRHCTPDGQGGVVLPWEKVERWTRQLDTPYASLPGWEQESDRIEVRERYLAIVRRYAGGGDDHAE